MDNPSITLVHDWLNQYGGAERVLEQLVHIFPGAPIYTSMYDRQGMPLEYRTWNIHTTWMDRLPGIYQHHQVYFPLYALAFTQVDLTDSACDLVLSNKSGFCHAVKTGEIPHLCYCLAPTRYVWQFDQYAARENLSPFQRVILGPVVKILRKLDYQAAQNTNLHFIAISSEIQKRISNFYQRSSSIIYPPVNLTRFSPEDTHDDYYLIVSRLIPYKRVDLAVKAFSEMRLPLKIVGDGRDKQNLEQLAGPTISFLGHISDQELVHLLSHCKAFIFPGYEDFGLAPLEAQASGRPVIAYKAGGALDTVVEGVTGTFFDQASPESLIEAVLSFNAEGVDPNACRMNAEKFSVERFNREIRKHIVDVLAESF